RSPIESHGPERLVNVSSSAGRCLASCERGIAARRAGATGTELVCTLRVRTCRPWPTCWFFRQPDAVSHVRVESRPDRARTPRRIVMPRWLKIGAAQMGPNQDGTPREAIVERMLALLETAARDGVELIVYPEMALTTYFPKRIRQDYDQFFETEVPPKALELVLGRAAEARVAVHVGFCEKADGKYFNTALLTDRDGRLCGTFRKIHLPGT